MKAYEVINSPDKWTKGYFARDKDGNYIPSRDEGAVCWCAMGAISKAYGDADRWCAEFVLEGNLNMSISDWNDDPKRTWEEVYNKLKELDI